VLGTKSLPEGTFVVAIRVAKFRVKRLLGITWACRLFRHGSHQNPLTTLTKRFR